MLIKVSLFLLTIVKVQSADYSQLKNVVTLDVYSFNNSLSSGRWLVLFHRKSCGGCQRYYPFFANLSAYLANWRPILNVGVIDCEDNINRQVCIDQRISSVPTLKYFPDAAVTVAAQNSSNGVGVRITTKKDLMEVRHSLLQHMRDEITSTSSSYEKLQDIVYEDFHHTPATLNISEPSGNIEKPDKKYTYERVPVYADDIFASLSILLHGDVSMNGNISGEELDALKEFLHMLQLLLPSSQEYKRKLTWIYTWVKSMPAISGKQWAAELNRTEFPDYRGEFVACKGSEPRFRGYPCGLWIMFHALTVRHYELSKRRLGIPADIVAHAMSRFIPRFFSCNICAFHFAANSANIAHTNESIPPINRIPPDPVDFTWNASIIAVLPEAPHCPSEEVLWLNAVHNRVNRRLSGADTEDPKAPKIIFPPIQACPKCWSIDAKNESILGGTEETRDHLLQFLLSHYTLSAWMNEHVPKHIFDTTGIEIFEESQENSSDLMTVAIMSVLLTLVAVIILLLLSRFFWKCRKRRTQGSYTPARSV
ncbi:hypothetical protein EG68_09442 [Paragonimus skrjabini miyazakii]|uniref:Sulfhydryl oxidase n=1 Tax=Paragonimus skrjabini miyazakii TaxID=59628 RepID=A0A8S9Y935_9TREM|nr:hypothetical protein EG68_09442 [Paragonimus skrjabini miyazakii]